MFLFHLLFPRTLTILPPSNLSIDLLCRWRFVQALNNGTMRVCPQKIFDIAPFQSLENSLFDKEGALEKRHFCSFVEKDRGLAPQGIPPSGVPACLPACLPASTVFPRCQCEIGNHLFKWILVYYSICIVCVQYNWQHQPNIYLCIYLYLFISVMFVFHFLYHAEPST